MTEYDDVERVVTPEQVDARLRSGRASFEDWLDCVQVCQRHGQWDKAETCAHNALAAALRRPLPRVKLNEAARAVISGALPRAGNGPDWLTEGANGLVQARELLRARRAEAIHKDTIAVIDEVLRDLDQMLLLITDEEAPSRVKLASLLREYDRPDLAVTLAEKVLAISGANFYALTVRAGARLDLGEVGGVEDAERAYRLGKSKQSLAVYVRALRMSGQLDDALRLALELVELAPTSASAALLATVAHAADDRTALEVAQELLERLGTVNNDHGADRQVRYLAARQLLRDGDLGEAQAALLDLLAERAWPAASALLDDVNRQLQLRDGTNAAG